MAQNTSLGWILSGGFGTSLHGQRSSLQCTADSDLAALVRRFWEQESESSTPAALTPDEEKCEKHFAHTFQRTASGRYMVRLPFATTPRNLADTRTPAERLLNAMERKGKQDPHFHELYQAFMREYENLQHMESVNTPEIEKDAPRCYLPHHGVFRETSSSTKLRVVFNGSQRTRSGESLNNCFLIGPNLLPTLADVLLRWRWHRYALVSDIEKMYRQILVHPRDRTWQRILWRHEADGEVREYRLNTVTYGLACAPFLAIRTLRQLAEDECTRFPRGAVALRQDCYVDDIVTSANTLPDAIAVQTELRGLCMAGGFPLRKWVANNEKALTGISSEHRGQKGLSWESEKHSTLGLHWHPADDQFSFTIRPRNVSAFTKRIVLAETSRLFDPLGWLAPVVIRAKILIQSTWLRHLEWDDPLPASDEDDWKNLFKELPLLDHVRVDRWLGTGGATSLVEIHGFSDASERGYAAVVYLRVSTGASSKLHLLAAKSKVAPVKQVSLPRLELCAAALFTSLTHHVQGTSDLFTAPVHLWSDSRITLHWIRGHPSRWKTYVANRVSQI